MQFKAEEVFLISGQEEIIRAGVSRLSPVIEQRIVIAKDIVEAYAILYKSDPVFRPVGNASLASLEEAAKNIRDTIVSNGHKPGWKLHISSSMKASVSV